MAANTNEKAEENLQQEEKSARECFLKRPFSWVNSENANRVTAIAAIVAVIFSVLGLTIASYFDLRARELEVGMATHQASVDFTQAAQGEQSLQYSATQAAATERGVAERNKPSKSFN